MNMATYKWGKELTDTDIKFIIADSIQENNRLIKHFPDLASWHKPTYTKPTDINPASLFTLCECGHDLLAQECIKDEAGPGQSRDCTFKCQCGKYYHSFE